MRADDPPAVDPPCPRFQAIRALLLVLTPSTVALAPLGTYGEVVALPWLIVAGVAGVLGACALFEVAARRRWARGLATLALGIWGLGWLGELRGDPGAGLLLLSAAVVTFGFLWPHERLRLATRRQRAAAASSERDSDGDSGLVLSGGVAIVLGWLARSPEVVDGPTACALAVAYAVPAVLGLRAFRAWGIRIAHLVALGAAGLPLAAWLGSPPRARRFSCPTGPCWR